MVCEYPQTVILGGHRPWVRIKGLAYQMCRQVKPSGAAMSPCSPVLSCLQAVSVLSVKNFQSRKTGEKHGVS